MELDPIFEQPMPIACPVMLNEVLDPQHVDDHRIVQQEGAQLVVLR